MKNNRTRELRFIVGFGADEHEYSVNGVRYVVSSRFQKPFEKQKNPMMSERINGYLSGDFAELTVDEHSDKMIAEYVCSTVGKGGSSEHEENQFSKHILLRPAICSNANCPSEGRKF